MNFKEAVDSRKLMLTEGAVVERLKNEFNIKLDKFVNHAGLIYNDEFRNILAGIYQEYIDVAACFKLPMMLMTPTRRANRERVQQSAYHHRNLNYDCVAFLKELRKKCGLHQTEIYIGGLMGCRGDAYRSAGALSVTNAYKFHSWQAHELQQAAVDYFFAGIMPALSEATGMAMALSATGIPYIISFMISENGRLLDRTSINDAIEHIDAATNRPPVGYMTNCVHPSILNKALTADPNKTTIVKSRFLGIQANTSAMLPEELNNSLKLKTEDPDIFAGSIAKLNREHHLNIYGGCCGTNKFHIEKIASFMQNR